MEAQTRAVFVSRSTGLIWTVLAGILAFSAAKAWFEPATTFAWYGPAFVLALTQVVLLFRKLTAAQAERVLLADLAATCAVIAWLGVASGHTIGSDLFLLGVAVNTAAFLPWAPRSQAKLAAMVAAAIVANGYGVNGTLMGSVDFRTLVPSIVLIGASIYTSYVLEAGRLQTARADLLRERAEAATHDLNAMLERRVLERTAELQAANDELEAFAYSVSHDLRAPLRAMDGLSEAVLEDYPGSLDDQARDYLRRIRAEARRLGDLVDDLLRLSRVTRAVMQRGNVDLSGLASAIAQRLRDSQPDRDVHFAIATGLRDHCDGSLARILLENVMENAFKFTRKTAHARIEFGCEQRGGERVYFVRDNGVGFDMTHVGRIFEAFERLHSFQDFEGTGIGLTTADRIVRRHGGSITAEAAPGKGATIRFTLSPAEEDIS